MSDASMREGKRVSLLRRRRGLSVAAFRDHWAKPHAAIACTMPGIARYTQNRVSDVVWTAAASEPAFAADGIVELEFRDERAMAVANASDAVRRLLPEDELRFLAAITLCRVPVGARQMWEGQTKVMLAVRLVEGASVHDLRNALETSDPLEISIDPVLGVSHRERLDYEAEPPEAFATAWFDPQRPLTSIFAEGSAWARRVPGLVTTGTAWRIDPLAIVA